MNHYTSICYDNGYPWFALHIREINHKNNASWQVPKSLDKTTVCCSTLPMPHRVMKAGTTSVNIFRSQAGKHNGRRKQGDVSARVKASNAAFKNAKLQTGWGQSTLASVTGSGKTGRLSNDNSYREVTGIHRARGTPVHPKVSAVVKLWPVVL